MSAPSWEDAVGKRVRVKDSVTGRDLEFKVHDRDAGTVLLTFTGRPLWHDEGLFTLLEILPTEGAET